SVQPAGRSSADRRDHRYVGVARHSVGGGSCVLRRARGRHSERAPPALAALFTRWECGRVNRSLLTDARLYLAFLAAMAGATCSNSLAPGVAGEPLPITRF